jgi:acyl-CoA hydrolase
MTPTYCRSAGKVVVEVNTNAPRCLGGLDEAIHIDHVDMVVEGPNSPLIQLPAAKAGEVDRQIAMHVMSLLEDGATIQLGIGALPNIVGEMIAQSDLKDLGVHTEMLADSYVDMYEAGRITGTQKAIDRRKMVYTFAMGSQKLYEFLHDNPAAAIFPASYTNDPAVIGRNPKVVAINNAVEIDLFSQVASESAGPRQISGTGGQLDFILGAYRSEGGKGLICVNSTYKRKDGSIGSRIVPTLSAGTIVTCPRSVVHYVVTEYGIAQMKAKSTWQRAEALIAIAHPEFREQLVKDAAALGVWRRSNRIA